MIEPRLKKLLLAAASFLFFSYFAGWQFALVLIGSLLFHEYGHVWMMKRYGMRVEGITLYPFGAVARTLDYWPSEKACAIIALMGPVWGCALALITLATSFLLHMPLLAAWAGAMGMLNAFNLLPIHPLDGGRVATSLAHSFSEKLSLGWRVLSLIACAFAIPLNPFVFMFLGYMGYGEFMYELQKRRRVPERQRIIQAIAKAIKCAPEEDAVIVQISELHASLGAEESERFRSSITRVAQDARDAISTTQDAALALQLDKDQRLDPFSPLFIYLKSEKAIPKMRALEALIILLAYIVLFVTLVAITVVGWSAPGARDAFYDFTH